MKWKCQEAGWSSQRPIDGQLCLIAFKHVQVSLILKKILSQLHTVLRLLLYASLSLYNLVSWVCVSTFVPFTLEPTAIWLPTPLFHLKWEWGGGGNFHDIFTGDSNLCFQPSSSLRVRLMSLPTGPDLHLNLPYGFQCITSEFTSFFSFRVLPPLSLAALTGPIPDLLGQRWFICWVKFERLCSSLNDPCICSFTVSYNCVHFSSFPLPLPWFPGYYPVLPGYSNSFLTGPPCLVSCPSSNLFSLVRAWFLKQNG